MATEVDIGDVLERPLPISRPAAVKPAKPVQASIAPKPRAKPFDGYANAKPNWPVILSIIALSVFWAAIFTVVTAALSLGSGS